MTPDIIGHYKINSLLGEGGIGRVYAATDQELGREVAIKALRPEFSNDAGFVDRFRAEAASLARLHHPNIATLFSMHREGKDLFMIMELVNGKTLESILTNTKRLGPRECLAIVAQSVQGLNYAHKMGVIHRDIKPSNLMLTEGGLLKIMDFGIARVRGSQRLTRDGSIVGTLAYIAPEQIKGAEGDERSDLYSLACVLYEMLAGTPPFSQDTEYELIRAQVEEKPKALTDRPKDLEPRTEQALMKALSKNPDDRFASLDEFLAALGGAELQARAVDIVRDNVLNAGKAAATRMISVGDLPAAGARPATKKAIPLLPVLGGLAAAATIAIGYFAYSTMNQTATAPGAQIAADTRTPPAATPIASQPEIKPAEIKTAEITPAGDKTGQPAAKAETASAAPTEPASSQIAALPSNVAPAANTAAAAAVNAAMNRVQGKVASFSLEGWPVIDGQTMKLFGVGDIASEKIKVVAGWVHNHGDVLDCEPIAGDRYRCLTTGSIDLAQALLLNGAGRTSADATPAYRQAEEQAKNTKRGVWQ